MSLEDIAEGNYFVVLIGPPGTGKTHIALAIGNKAVRQGYKSASRLSFIKKCDILATALLDRLTHRCQILNFADESYRLANRKHFF